MPFGAAHMPDMAYIWEYPPPPPPQTGIVDGNGCGDMTTKWSWWRRRRQTPGKSCLRLFVAKVASIVSNYRRATVVISQNDAQVQCQQPKKQR